MLPMNQRLMEVGKIKIGGLGEECKKKSGQGSYRLPVKLDYFNVVTNERDTKTGDFKQDVEVMKILGVKPKEMEIMLLHNSVEDNWQSFRAFYTGSGKVFCRSDDGVNASRAMTTTNDKGDITSTDYLNREQVSCPCPLADGNHPDNKSGKTLCKPHGRLTCIIPESAQLGGVYVFRTTSWNSIRNIQAQLEFIHSLTHGILAGLKFTLRVSPKSAKYNDGGKQKSTTIWEVGLFFKGDHKELLSMAETHTKNILKGRVEMASLAKRRLTLEANQYEQDKSVAEEFNPDAVEGEIEDPLRLIKGSTKEGEKDGEQPAQDQGAGVVEEPEIKDETTGQLSL